MVQYKVDWLAFSIKFASQDIDPFSLDLFEELGYDLENLKKRSRIFLQFWLDVLPIRKCVLNDPTKKRHANSSDTLTVVFTGRAVQI